MATIARALARIKEDVGRSCRTSRSSAACREAGHRWRERVLGPVRTLHLFVLQVLHFNHGHRGSCGSLGRAAVQPRLATASARARYPLAARHSLLRASGRRRGAGGRTCGAGCGRCWWTGPAQSCPTAAVLGEAFGHPAGSATAVGSRWQGAGAVRRPHRHAGGDAVPAAVHPRQ
jgi:hypothetical protein